MTKKKQVSAGSSLQARTWLSWPISGALAVLIAITIIAFQPIFDDNKQFVNWDDDAYITEQPLVRSLSGHSIAQMFDTDTRVSSNYHPMTMLSLAIDVDRGGIAVHPFMQTNLILHLFNVILVFTTVLILFDRNVFAALAVAMLFAVHPMHVESVAWASARKDVLYTFFYMLALISYIIYAKTERWRYYIVTALLFTLSCLSKPMAVTLPVVLLLIDGYVGRLASSRMRCLIEKTPLFVASAAFGLLTFSIQSSGADGLVDTTTYSQFDRIIFAGYGILMYLSKLIAPLYLSAFYPYPSELQPGNVPLPMYVGAMLIAASIVGIIVMWLRQRTPFWNMVAFGVGFYLVTVSLVLQLVSVGGAMMADRYTYVPYIGLGLVIVAVATRLTNVEGRERSMLVAVTVVGCLLAYQTHQRVQVWENSDTLWTDVIRQFPYEFGTVNGRETLTRRGALYAYSNRGIHYIMTGKLDQAVEDLQTLARAGVTHPDSYRALGVALQRLSRHPEAITAFTTAMRQGDLDFQVYRARGASYLLSGQPDAAIQDFLVALTKQPGDPLTTKALGEARAVKLARSGG